MQILVQDEGACYPLTIDPVAQQSYLKASNTEADDSFGISVAISGDTLVVGAPGEDSNATGVDGDEGDNSATNSGAVYVFVRSGTSWIQQAYLKASNTGTFDGFGGTVAISGDTVVVCANSEDSNATGVGGDETDNSANNAGAVYVFTRSGTSWSQQAYLKASNTSTFDRFGTSISIDGDTIVVGASSEDSNAVGVNGDDTNNSAAQAGAAYVFVRSGTSWSQEAYLKASNTDADDRFGSGVGVSGDTIVVSALFEASNATGVNGTETNNSATFAGAAYVFVRSGSTWSQQAYLKASNTGSSDTFGESVAISGDTIAVAADNEGSDATGVNGDDSNDDALESGAVYIFVRTGSTWMQQAYLKASNTELEDRLGWSVAISGNTVIAGALFEDSGATGVDGDDTDNTADASGAAYVFVRTGTSWSQHAYLKASNTDAGDGFGQSVAVSGGTAIVGAADPGFSATTGESSTAVGVDGDETNNDALDAGAAYTFLLQPEFAELCNGDGGDQMGCTNCPCFNNALPGTPGGCLNSAGTSTRLSATGSPSLALLPGDTTDLRFTASGSPPGATNVLLSGNAVAPTGMMNPCFGEDSGILSVDRDGLRCAVQSLLRHGNRTADTMGNIMDSTGPNRVWGGEAQPNDGIGVQAGFVAGQTRYFQITHRDDIAAVCMRGLNTSQAVEVTFTP